MFQNRFFQYYLSHKKSFQTDLQLQSERESKIQVTLTLQKKTRYNTSDNFLKKLWKKGKLVS